MLYRAYQHQSDFMAPLRAIARAAPGWAAPWVNAKPFAASFAEAGLEMIARAGLSHARPAFDLETVRIGDAEMPVVEETVLTTPFGTLLRFRKEGAAPQPRLLVVAPLSGHFATLLRGTVKALLPDHDVYITDWHNAQDVSAEDGRFGFDDYVDHVVRFLDAIGPGGHVLAVCQPCVQVLAAVALMAQADHPAQPRSMTLMAGPVDTRVNPSKVNELAMSQPIEWFERQLIATVPGRYRGAGRRVYPGFVQLTAFMAMNMDRHLKAHTKLFEHLVAGETEKAAVIKAFYDEYFAVLDLAAEFYLETVRVVFQEQRLARGDLRVGNNRVEPRAIRKTALLTVEGERDDICSIGQTLATHELCSGLRPYRKRHHLQAGTGHYGVFSGKKWETQICPIVRNHILASE